MAKKIVLAGESGVGKTSIFIKYIKSINDPYCNETINTYTTIGAAYDIINVGGNSVGVWDTAGQERYRCLCSMYFRDTDMCILVFDVTDKKSYNSLNFWIKQIPKEKNPTVLILANKTDANKSVWKVNDEDIKILEKYGTVIETSAIDRTNFCLVKENIFKKFSVLDSTIHEKLKINNNIGVMNTMNTYCCF